MILLINLMNIDPKNYFIDRILSGHNAVPQLSQATHSDRKKANVSKLLLNPQAGMNHITEIGKYTNPLCRALVLS